MLFVSDNFELSKDKIVVLTKFYPQTKITNTGNATANILKSKDGIHWLALTSLASNQSLDITLEEAFIYLTFKEDTTVYFQHQTPNHYHLDNEQNQLNARFDSLSVGGRNLLFNTANFSRYLSFTNRARYANMGSFGRIDTISSGHVGILVNTKSTHTIKANEQAILSFEYRTDMPNLLYTYIINDNNNWRIVPIHTVVNDGQWQKAIMGFTAPRDLTNIRALMGAMSAPVGSYLEISKVKLERGNIATDWTQAPEDLQSLVDALITRITALENR